jgi:hypothetical protein
MFHRPRSGRVDGSGDRYAVRTSRSRARIPSGKPGYQGGEREAARRRDGGHHRPASVVGAIPAAVP